MKNHLARQDGATIVEILAAVGVFSITAAGLSPALLSTRTATDRGTNRSIASALASDKLEQIRTLNSGVLTNGSDGPLNAVGGTSQGIFTRTWTVLANTPTAGVNEIVTTVSWRERSATNTVKLVALVMP